MITETDPGPPATAASPAVRSRPGRPLRIGPSLLLMLIAFGGLFVAGWSVHVALAAPQPVRAVILIAHVCGMLAGYGVVVLVGLMSRTPALEQGVGADRLARWHGRGGRAVVGLILVHAVAASTAWIQSRGLPWWQGLGEVLGMPGLVAATVSTALFLLVAAVSVRAARRRVSFERWHAVHLLVYIAVALGFVHQLAGPDLTGHRWLQIAWALLYVHVFVLVLRHRVVTPMRNAARHRMRVREVRPEGRGVVSVIIEGHELDALEARSGQFFRWRFLAPDHWATAHPFSLSAAPTSTELRLTVKTLGDGSRRIQDLEPGTWVLAEGPYGAVTSERRTRRNVTLIAGGVGITPMRALFETMPLEPGQDLLLIYRARTHEDVIFGAELEEIAARRDGARVHYLLGAGRTVDARTLGALMPDAADRDVFLCGSPPFAAAVRRSLKQLGLPEHRLHEERFDA